MSGVGFKPGTTIQVFLFSTPTLLGEALVKADGSFVVSLMVSTEKLTGEHTMQLQGTSISGEQRKAEIGVVLESNPFKQIMLLDRVFYGTNISKLTKSSNVKLNAVAKTIKALKYSKIWLHSFTDVSKGVNGTKLSGQRASNVKLYLQKLLPKVSIYITFVSTVNPKAKGSDKAALALNGRVEIYGQK